MVVHHVDVAPGERLRTGVVALGEVAEIEVQVVEVVHQPRKGVHQRLDRDRVVLEDKRRIAVARDVAPREHVRQRAADLPQGHGAACIGVDPAAPGGRGRQGRGPPRRGGVERAPVHRLQPRDPREAVAREHGRQTPAALPVPGEMHDHHAGALAHATMGSGGG